MSLWVLPSLVAVFLAISLSGAILWKRRTSAFVVNLLPVMGIVIWIHGLSVFGTIHLGETLWWKRLVLVGELFLPVALGYVAHAFDRALSEASSDRSGWWWRGIAVVTGLLTGFILFAPTPIMLEDFSGAVVFVQPWGWIIWGVILLSLVVVLSQFERILRALEDPLRYQLKFVLIGLGGLTALAIVQASQIVLLPVWKSTFVWIDGMATAISLLLMGFGLGRWRIHDIHQKIQISHQALYTSLTFIVVGGYLISVGLLAELIQQTGWEFREAFVTLILFISTLFAVAVVFSRLTRLHLQRFMARHFLRSKYDYREKWLEVTETFSSCREVHEIWDRYLQWLSRTFAAPRISIWKYFEADGQFHQIRSVNTENPPPPLPGGHFLPRALQRSPDPILVSSLTPSTPNDLQAFLLATNALVCVPVGYGLDHLLGFCTLSQDQHGKGYDHDDFDLLRVVAHHVAMLLLQFHLQDVQTASAKWEAVHKFSGFYLHDLKNLTSSLSMVAQNADQYGHDPDFQASAMRTVRNTSQRMMELMGKLATHTKSPLLSNHHELHPVNMNELVSEAIQGMNGMECQPVFHAGSHLPPIHIQCEALKQLVLNLVLNARQAMPQGGRIDVTTALGEGAVVLEVLDTGPGMSSEQIEHLFEPFRSSKQTGLGVGLYQCKRIVEDHQGTIRVESRIGKGTKIIVTFPIKTTEKE